MTSPDRLAYLREQEVLTPADVHVTEAITRLTGRHDDDAMLGVALAVRAPRLGHVCLDLPRTREVGLAALGQQRVDIELPALSPWLASLADAPSVRTSGDADREAPLVLDGQRLYLDRYWRYEQRLVARIQGLLDRPPTDRDPAALASHLDVLFPAASDDLQRRAAEVATRSALTVLTGGPGTGKTTTVVRLLAALQLTAAGQTQRIVLAAPTGKAAARLAEAIRGVAATLDVPAEIRDELQRLPAVTLHRLLGWQPGSPTRFRHDARRPVPYDIVVVDEASMASLPLMTKLLDALGDQTRLVLVGDRDQLASVDAGAVLSDICGPRGDGGSGDDIAGAGDAGAGDVEVAGETDAAANPPAPGRLADSIVTLTRFHRFGPDSGIGAVARAIQRVGDESEAPAAEVLSLLRGEWTEPGGPERYEDVALVPPSAQDSSPLPTAVMKHVVDVYAKAITAALADAPALEVLAAFDRLRVLTALRRGPDGVESLTAVLGRRLAAAVPGYEHDESYPLGQPVMVTRNDHQLQVYNGDVGVVVRDPEDPTRRRVAFPTAGGEVRFIAPARLPAAEPVFAMSVHKSQGSQFDEVVLVLPRTDSPLLSRELVYTGITRAAAQVTIVADEETLAAALGRQVQRASGLTERLWHPDGPSVTHQGDGAGPSGAAV